MIVLRALPLSLSIFWRMLLILPILLAVLASFVLVSAILSVVLGLMGMPVLAFIMVAAVMLSFFTTPLLLGNRMGLTAHGLRPRNTISQLLFPATGYGLVVGFLTALIVVAGGLAFFNLTNYTKFDVAQMTGAIAQRGVIAAAMENAGPLLIITAATLVILHAFYAAILLPLASASIGTDANGNAHTPFAGFGAGFVPLLAIVFIVGILNYAMHDLAAPVMALPAVSEQMAILQDDLVMMSAGLKPFGFTWQMGVLLGALTLIWLWTVSFQSAGATLVYLDRQERHKRDADAERQVARMDSSEVRALWKDRMQNLQLQ